MENRQATCARILFIKVTGTKTYILDQYFKSGYKVQGAFWILKWNRMESLDKKIQIQNCEFVRNTEILKPVEIQI